LFSKLPVNLVRQRTVDALKTLVVAEARDHPLVLILEDVHWIDKATEEVVGTLVEAMADIPLLLLLVYRRIPARLGEPGAPRSDQPRRARRDRRGGHGAGSPPQDVCVPGAPRAPATRRAHGDGPGPSRKRDDSR